jgi:1-acyl-sn-glycerol-3-phosphate acyltransferase
MIYFATRLYVKIALWFFYKELSVRGLENIPKDKPIIFTPNHQNSFIDAILITCIVHRPIHYLVRASVFKSKIAKWFLNQLNMMPIYRFRDGLKEVKKNDQIMTACAKLLSENKCLMIFPEGNHNMKYAIRPLQKGTARMAFQSIDKYQSDVNIVPVGIYYEDHKASRSRVLVNFGKPISAQRHYQLYNQDPQRGYVNLMNEISLAMQQLTLNVKPKERYDDVLQKYLTQREMKPNIEDQFDADQKLVAHIILNDPSSHSNEPSSKTEIRKSNWFLFPIYFYGMINHITPYLILRKIITNKVTDIHFYSSMKLAIGMVLIPVFYGLQASILHMSGVEYYWIILYLITLPNTGIIALRYYRNSNT